jgi:adenine/guanine phosphoribosyltransferase-like PRPP-binding protein
MTTAEVEGIAPAAAVAATLGLLIKKVAPMPVTAGERMSSMPRGEPENEEEKAFRDVDWEKGEW